MGTDAMIRFGDSLRRYRRAADLTQETLAGLVGLPPSVIGQFEGAFRRPKLDSLVRLADVLDVRLDRLTGRVRAPAGPDPLAAALADLSPRDRGAVLALVAYLNSGGG